MNREQFKTYLQRDKQFLKELYESDSVTKSRRILNFASDSELNTLMKYFHFICNGEIPIKKQNFDALEKKHFNLIKKNFEKKGSLQKLLQNARKFKLLLLVKVVPALSNVLAPLFKE